MIEVAVGYALILATIWTGNPVRAYFGWMAVVWLIVSIILGARRTKTLGLGLRGIRESLWAVALALIGATAIVAGGAWCGTLHCNYSGPYPPMIGYFVWSFVQQFVLQNLFLSRLLRILKSPALAIVVAGGMMSAAHLPNMVLAVATLFWGIAACWLFFQYRNLYVVGLMHFFFGFALAVSLPSSIHHNMRVGRGYSRYRQTGDVSRIPMGSARQLNPHPLVRASE